MAFGEYNIRVLQLPLEEATKRKVELLWSSGRPDWEEKYGDVHGRCLGVSTGILAAVAECGPEFVSYACIYFDGRHSYSSGAAVGMLSHVLTHPQHRRRGLSSKCLQALFTEWDLRTQAAPVICGTNNQQAELMYTKVNPITKQKVKR